ncbi:MAG TPA: zf-HC2 domain-containing protein [Gemmataceae bacterium]|nr:zf-HC2 domain-containing protein [Gemmataceae bacterium]
MKCTDVRIALPLLIYGEQSADDAALKEHLANCADCRREHEALIGVRRLLTGAPVPNVTVDVSEIQRSLAERQIRTGRNWRRVALGMGGIAAVLLLALGLRLEVRLDANQLVVRWGDPPVDPAFQPDTTPPERQAGKPDLREDLHILSDLIHALKQDADERDQRFTERLDRLQQHVHALQSQSDTRWDTTEKDVAALYLLTRKGE